VSAPVSVLSTSTFSQSYDYRFASSIPLAQDGSGYFPLTVGSSVFHVGGAGDQNGQPAWGRKMG